MVAQPAEQVRRRHDAGLAGGQPRVDPAHPLVEDGAPDGEEVALLARAGQDRLGHGGQLLVAVADEHVGLAREVAEERGRGDLGLRRDLLDGGGFVALLLEQRERGVLDRRSRPHLLALAEAVARGGGRGEHDLSGRHRVATVAHLN
jgi:hypothetical protein